MKIKYIWIALALGLPAGSAQAMLVRHTELNGVFWGCFDPPTLAHKAIALQALKDTPLKKLILVINNDRRKTYTYPLTQRHSMLAKMFEQEEAIEITSQSDIDRLDYFKLKEMGYTPLCAIAGYDSYKKWLRYSKQEDRSLYDKILIVPRGEEVPVLQDENASLLEIETTYRGISSRLVKSLLKRGQDVSDFLDPGVLACIEHSNL